MHVSVYVFAHMYVSIMYIHTYTYHVYNKVVSKFTITIIAKSIPSLRTMYNVQASRLARGTLMWSLSTHNWSAYGINMANAAAA